MKKIFLLLFLLSMSFAESRNIKIFDVDASDYPLVRLTFNIYNDAPVQLSDLEAKDFELKFNDSIMNITGLKKPGTDPAVPLSTVLMVDASLSMEGAKLVMAKEAARAWISNMPQNSSDCAITSFDYSSYFIRDFTTDKAELLSRTDDMFTGEFTSIGTGFTGSFAGAFEAVKYVKHKKVIILLTDGLFTPDYGEQQIIDSANAKNISIYVVVLGNKCQTSLKKIALQTGGRFFESIMNTKDLISTILALPDYIRGAEPFVLEWNAIPACGTSFEAELNYLPLGINAVFSYEIDPSLEMRMEFIPPVLNFDKIIANQYYDDIIEIKAVNTDIEITNIKSSNDRFYVYPSTFSIKKGKSDFLHIWFRPLDNGYTYTDLEIVNNLCPAFFHVTAGNPGIKPSSGTLHLTSPNSPDVYMSGSDTLITWEGISPADNVELYYRPENNMNWNLITDNATGNKYRWKIPKVSEGNYLVKARKVFGNLPEDGKVLYLQGVRDVSTAAFSPDGKSFFTAGSDSLILIWDFKSGKYVKIFHRDLDCGGLERYSPDGKMLAYMCGNTIRLMDGASGEDLNNFGNFNGKITCMAFSPDSKIIAGGTAAGDIKLFNTETGALITSLPIEHGLVHKMGFSPDGTSLLCSHTNELVLYDVPSGKAIKVLTANKNDLGEALFCPDKKNVLYSQLFKIILADTVSGKTIREFTGHKSNITGIALTSDGKYLASCSMDSTVRLWNTATGDLLWTYSDTTSMIQYLSISKDNKYVLGGGGSLRILDINSGKDAKQVVFIEPYLTGISFSPNDKYFITSGPGNLICFRDIKAGALIKKLKGNIENIQNISLSKDGSMLATIGENIIDLWDLGSGTIMKKYEAHNERALGASFSSDGQYLVTCGSDKKVKLWSVEGGSLVKTFEGHESDVNSVDISPDGKYIISCSGSKLVLHEISTGNIMLSVSGHSDKINKVKFSPNGKYFGSCSNDKILKLWDASSGDQLNEFKHSGAVLDFAFSPDSTIIASTGSDYDVKVWDISIGEIAISLPDDNYQLSRVAFNFDGSILAGAGYNVNFWKFEDANIYEDISDNPFKVQSLKVDSKPVNLGKAWKGVPIELTCKDFVKNSSVPKIKIDSIYIEGGTAGEFGILSNTGSQVLSSGAGSESVFTFNPQAEGARSADLVVLAQSDTIRNKISGEGVVLPVYFSGENNDFGTQYINTEKSRFIKLSNEVDHDSKIDSIKLLLPDRRQYQCKDTLVSTLKPGDTRDLAVTFKPLIHGRISGRLGVYLDGMKYPIISNLKGIGIDPNVNVEEDKPSGNGTDGWTITATPNPATDYVDLSFDCTGGGVYELYITDLSGGLYLPAFKGSEQGKLSIRFDIAGLAPGVYIAVMQSKAGSRYSMFIKN